MYLYGCIQSLGVSFTLLMQQITFAVVGATMGVGVLVVVSRDPPFGSYIMAGFGGILGLKLADHFIWGDTLAGKCFKFGWGIALGVWFAYFLASPAFFDAYYRYSFSEYLNNFPSAQFQLRMSGYETWSEAGSDAKLMGDMRRNYASWIARLDKWEQEKKEIFQSEIHSDFTRSAAYGNHMLSKFSDYVGNKAVSGLDLQTWVNGPTSKFSNSLYSLHLHHPSRFRLRIIGHLVILLILAVTVISLHVLGSSSADRLKNKTLVERLASYAGLVRLLFLASYAVGCATVAYYLPFIGGPPEALYPFVASPLFGFLSWILLLKD